MENEDKSLTVLEVARRLNVSIFTIRELLNDEELPGYKVRNRWRIKEQDLDNFINKRMKGVPVSR